MNARGQHRHTTKNTPEHAHHHDSDEERIFCELRDRGYRITVARKKIIEALTTAVNPKTAKEIAERTKIKDASTVYRTLNELVKEQLVAEFADRGVALYEVAHHHHDHAICVSCGAMEHIPCESKRIPRVLAKAGWTIESHEALYRGLCASCGKLQK